MITVFNRKELLITFDMKRQGDVRDILSANGIHYTVKATNHQNASGRAKAGNLGMNQNFAYEYKIYVHKKDYDSAMNLIR